MPTSDKLPLVVCGFALCERYHLSENTQFQTSKNSFVYTLRPMVLTIC